MRLLHTADLHLGRQFNGISLEPDHDAVLDQIAAAVAAHEVDALVIAGDVFDRAAPSASAVRQFNAFLARIRAETGAAVVMIAGNHDSGDRIEAMSVMTDTARALIRGTVAAEEPPLILEDAHGAVAISALPFAWEYAAREAFGDESLASPEDVMRAQIAAARAALPEGARWVIVAHGTVAGAAVSDAERPLARIGGVETVGAELFDGAQYVALGHLHRPQSAGRAGIRYAGAPLAFGFDEAGEEKSMSLVEIGGAGEVRIAPIPFRPIRGVRVIEGRHADLLHLPPTEDFLRVVLTDEAPVIDAMRRLRAVFPNACDLAYAREMQAPEVKALGGAPVALDDPLAVIGDFLTQLRGEGPDAAELAAIVATLDGLRGREEGA
ncbi:exonuclease SbcCD subunit D [Rhodovulum visakhapatnamense]|uniref:Nuclease SbcCD subunit D n=1 Tax=Rhodovulum visakhapatnamense TaxID=364297 RepID=A0A4V6QAP4_9RHOB|nr:exonuclease SbcCD subunit D [Rhodovulum visakhapatnamense]TDX25553.1 exodeoxyribonuclease I subunit D [Rhodovulum visakhapatnamense]